MKTLEAWLKQVNQQLILICGLGIDDLPDCCYADWYEDGLTPKQAAKRAMKNAEF